VEGPGLSSVRGAIARGAAVRFAASAAKSSPRAQSIAKTSLPSGAAERDQSHVLPNRVGSIFDGVPHGPMHALQPVGIGPRPRQYRAQSRRTVAADNIRWRIAGDVSRARHGRRSPIRHRHNCRFATALECREKPDTLAPKTGAAAGRRWAHSSLDAVGGLACVPNAPTPRLRDLSPPRPARPATRCWSANAVGF
jgi:hypothetical protein